MVKRTHFSLTYRTKYDCKVLKYHVKLNCDLSGQILTI